MMNIILIILIHILMFMFTLLFMIIIIDGPYLIILFWKSIFKLFIIKPVTTLINYFNLEK